jgi:hypothetical protein
MDDRPRRPLLGCALGLATGLAIWLAFLAWVLYVQR